MKWKAFFIFFKRLSDAKNILRPESASLMISSLPGVKYGAAHYKYLKQDKTNALKISKGCIDAMNVVSPQFT